ncbi:MAG TPA: hypothetical protein VGE61_10555 [Glycomyces sp.]
MPESIRSLLHDIANEGSEPTRDLAAGAYRRARGITRRRIAAGAVGVVTALALAGAGTAGLIRHQDPGLPPAENPTTTREDSTTPEDETDEGTGQGCNIGVDDWDDQGYSFPARGDSGAAELSEIPDETLYRSVDADGEEATVMVSGDDTSILDVGDYVYYPAPDGDRVMAVDKSDGCSGVYLELHDSGFEAQPVFSFNPTACPITWSPDSNKVLFTEDAGAADAKSYVLDVSTGEVTDLPAELYCTAKWLPDSEHLWDNQGKVMRYDGTDATDVGVVGDGGSLIAAGLSADMGEACLHETEGDSPGWRCDRYFDLASGEELDLPVVGGPTDDEVRQVEFLEDGSMLILNQTTSAATLYLVGPDGELVDELELPQELIPTDSQVELLSWFTG